MSNDVTYWISSLLLGIGLSASCGFRIFIPLLISNIGSKLGLITITQDMAWLGSYITTIVLVCAVVVEIVAYYITYIDNLLDTIALPLSIIAGTLVTTQFLEINEPIFKWALGLLAGGGIAGTVQLGTTGLRLASTKFTAGFGNVFLSTAENILATLLSVLTIWLPIFMGILSLILVYCLVKKIVKRKSLLTHQ